ncbi:MAG: SusD/RagB family nutrient-binding outer membrane lipoprotein [Bacteroidota bacterium]
MSINNKIVLAAAVALTLGASSCRKLLDVNTNPNISQTATVQTLLPAGQLYVASAMGVDMQVNGSIWAQYWTQTPVASQYVAIDQYAPGQDAYSTSWESLYRGASNFRQLYNLADSQKKKPYKAIALLMQAYTFQVLTDGWGDIPFTEALHGQYADSHIVAPKYDSQRVVYMGILSFIDSAKKMIVPGEKVTVEGDLMYGGVMSQWMKFANTLQLKVLLRMAYVDPVNARAKIDSLYLTNPSFIGSKDDARIEFGFNSNNKSPLYAEASSATMAGAQNLAGSSTAIDSLNSNNDYRIAAFYGLSNTGYTGIRQGNYDGGFPGGSYSIPSVYVGGDAQDVRSGNAPVNLLTSWESYFLQAEVAARGWGGSSGGDDALFYAGIRASFDYYESAFFTELEVHSDSAYKIYTQGDVPGGIAPGYWTVYPTTGTTAEKLRFIITQKWFAMNGNQGFEAWTEWRRTGYPDFFVRPKNSLMGSSRPARFLYPTSESTTNTNFPGVMPLVTRVWWDVI